MIQRRWRAAGASLAAIALILSGGVAGAQEASNQSANGYRISPIRSELTIEKGKRETLQVSVENPTQSPAQVKAVVNNFVAGDDEGGVPRLLLDNEAEQPKNDFRSLIASELGELSLGAGERKSVDVEIAVPEDASAGGYYGAIRFLPATSADESTVGLVASVGSIVLVTVPGDLTEKVSLEQMSAAQEANPDEFKAKSFITSGPVYSQVRLKNTGDIHVKPFGRVEVKNMFGKVVASYELNGTDPRSNILPGTIRAFNDKLEEQKWLGRYTITANIGYSQGSGDIISAQTSFWYIPKWAAIVLVVLLVAIVAGVYLLVRRMNGRSRHSSKR
ncbi:hypothetical protein CR970_03310 [Candidatus Saccharibacteria bacterium]|nr:MAG: hypothetical protein CR970_03310 [Candidatus Saccharibacteria bacterium]